MSRIGKEPVLKTGKPKGDAGSSPAPSASRKPPTNLPIKNILQREIKELIKGINPPHNPQSVNKKLST